MAYLDENGLEHFWGKIKDHVDSAVAPKADDEDVVHKTGDETVQGEKVFKNEKVYSTSGSHVSNISIRNPSVERGTATDLAGGKRVYSGLFFLDNEGSEERPFNGRLATIEYATPSTNDLQESFRFRCYDYFSENGGANVDLNIGYDTDRIPYATAPETSDDRTNSTDIITRGYMEASEWNWQKSKKDALVQFKPAPESDLEPVVDFMFTETPPVEGEKGPENPSTVTGITAISVGRCGKNLVKNNTTPNPGSIFTVDNETGVLTANGTIATYVSFQYRFPFNKPLPAGRYLLSFNNPKADSNIRCSLRAANGNWGSGSDIGRDGYLDSVNKVRVVEIQSGSTNTMLFLAFYPGTYENFSVAMQLESMPVGDVPSAYESPVRQEYVVQLGDTYYGGSLDVATGVMTVTHHSFIFDGTESWILQESYSNVNIFSYDSYASALRAVGGNAENHVCSHYNRLYNWFSDTEHFYIGANTTVITIFSEEQTLDAFKSFLATQYANGTPVIVTYELVTPKTIQLTPTQIRSLPALDKYEPRINTVYTDQEAVQVGYQRYVGEDNLVHKTGDEDISGWKKFNGPVRISGGLQIYGTAPYYHIVNSTLTQSALPSSGQYSGYVFTDKDMKAYHKTQVWVATDGSSGWACLCNAFDNMGGNSFDAAYALYLSKTGSANTAAVSKVDAFRPDQSNSITLGTSNNRWKEVWTNASAINSSDERIKTFIESVPDDVLDAWGEVDFCQFKFNDAVVEKGADKARVHGGLIAQRIDSVFKNHNLDISRYGLFCYDEWDSESEIKDNEGNVIRESSEAGNLYSIRYAEALCMEAAYMRRENARLKKRIADLEERLAALELKIS